MRLHLLACSLALVACSSSGSTGAGPSTDPAAPLQFTGAVGQPIAATVIADTLVIDLTIDGVKSAAVVDTGSPVVALDPGAFAGASLPAGAGPVASMDVGALAFTNPYVVGAKLVSSPDPSVPFSSTFGCAVLCSFVAAFNYRDATLTLGAGALPSGVAEPGSEYAFALLGGGEGTIQGVPGAVHFPKSRIIVTAAIEGIDRVFVLDTGSSFVFLRKAIFAEILQDGRKELGGVGTATQSAQSTSSIARLRSAKLGSEEVDGIIAAQDDAIDTGLDGIGNEVGRPIDGLLGGSFLRNFHVTIDYPAFTLHLRRYTTGAPTFDLLDRPGVGIDPATGAVSQVFAGTDAATKGVAVGDVVVAIDGKPLAGKGATALDALLSGSVGSTKMVQFGKATAPSLANQTVALKVEDLLALK